MAQARCFMLCAKLACDETDWQRQSQYLEKALIIARECAAVSTWCTCLDLLIDVVRHQGDVDKAEALERERQSLFNPYEVPEEMVEEFTQALATGNSETAQAALRKLFAQ
jgi:hypothetical protein